MSTRRHASASLSAWIAAGLLFAIVGMAILLPAGVVLSKVIAGASRPAALPQIEHGVDAGLQSWFSLRLALLTLLWSGLVAVLCTILAWPAAWYLRARGWSSLPVLLAPMLLPSYLAYAGWGLWRAPGTYFGNKIEAAAQTARWLPGLVAQGLAVLGLAMWTAPLAAILMAASLKSVDRAVIDSLRMERGSALRRLAALIPMASAARAVVVVWLLMLGSAIPFHVAQMETYAIKVWLAMDLAGPKGQWKPWAQAWPLVAIAIAAGCLIGNRAENASPDWAAETQGSVAPGRHRFLFWAILALSVGMPALSLLSAIRDPGAILRFWSTTGAAVQASLSIAIATAAIVAILAALVWFLLTLGGFQTGLARLSVRLFLITGLIPGILIGSAFCQTAAESWMPLWAGDGQALTILAHVSRFGFLGVLAACWLRVTEARDERDSRAVDGVVGIASFARASMVPRLGVILGAGAAAGMLSFHEIESSILLRPPSANNLPRQILNNLHFWRTEELSVAALWLLTIGIAVALGVSRVLVGGATRSVASTRAQGQYDPPE